MMNFQCEQNTQSLLLSVFEVETEKTSDYNNNEESSANRKKTSSYIEYSTEYWWVLYIV